MQLDAIKSKIKGPVFPIVTPFKDNFDIDYTSLKNYIDFLYKGGARIFHVMAHTSRFGLLTNDEMLKLNRTVATHVKSKYNDCIVIVADPLYKSTQTSVEFAQRAADDGADVIGLIYMERIYFENQVYDFFETVANKSQIAILIHEQQLNAIHGAQLIPFPINLLKRIADIETVIAVKEDAKEDDYTKEAVEAVKDKLAIIVSGGSKEQFMKFAPLGCPAYLVGVASFYPEIAVRFYDEYLKGNLENCWDIINRYERPFFKVAKELGWHIGLKAAMDYLGTMSATERPPLCSLNSDHYQKVADVTKKIMAL